MRVRSSTRWWWTAEVSSSDGMGAKRSLDSRSDSTISRAPRSMASETSRRTRRIALRRPRPPRATGYRPEMTSARNSEYSSFLPAWHRVTKSWLSRIGCSSRMRRAASAVGSRMLVSAPSNVFMLVMDFSRSESNGGLVTCANRCEKKSNSMRGRLDSAAIGVSEPIEPRPSAPVSAIGRMMRSTSSSVMPKTRCRNTARACGMYW